MSSLYAAFYLYLTPYHETMLQAHAKDHEILVAKALNMFGRELKSFFVSSLLRKTI
jgi:hypothetical protein